MARRRRAAGGIGSSHGRKPRQPRRPFRRAAIANLGCKVNQAEMDAVERLLRARGVELVGAHEAADLVVVNTCTVTSIADQKSRQAVRRARRTNPDAQVLVTGCSVAVDRGVAGRGRSGGAPLRQRVQGPAADRAGGPARYPRRSRAAEPLGRRTCGRTCSRAGPAGRARGGRRFGRGRLRAGDRSNARLRQDPGRLLVPLHLLHHPQGPRPGAVGARRDGARPRYVVRCRPAIEKWS